MKIFRAPSGVCVCVSDRHVFVSDVNRGSSCVFMFTVAGDYATFLGKYGSKEGQFKTVHVMCVEIKGFVFVADHGNNRVQCF